MQANVVRTEAFAEVEGGWENEDMCLLAWIFTKSTRLSILLLAVHWELQGRYCERITETALGQQVA